MTTTRKNALINLGCIDVAIEHFGNRAELARAMGVSDQNVYNWCKRGTFPTANALEIERISNGAVKARDVLLENENLETDKA